MEEQGPFDRILQAEPPPKPRDWPAAGLVGLTVVLGALLLILVLPPVSIFDDGVQLASGASVTIVAQEELPPPPAGFASVSPLYDLFAPEELGAGTPLTVSLSTTVEEGAPLVFFTLDDDEWRQIAEAAAVNGGKAARAKLPALPPNLAVFQAREQALLVLGSLPAGAQPDERALGVISTLNPAGFVPAADGSVAGNVQPPPNLQLPVAPTISALAPAEVDAVNAILASPELRASHAQAILSLARDRGFAGIDLDYRAIDPALEADFVAFAQELSGGLRGERRSLSLTLPLPVRDGDEWDTLGFDWAALAPLVDAIKLAPEPEQDRYYQRAEEALAFLVPRVGSSKLFLTIGPLSRERGVDGVRTLTLTEALVLAGAPSLQGESPVAPEAAVQAVGQNLSGELGASGPRWDDTARAITFTYTGLGGARTVWIANAFSEAFKLDLARRYQLGGVAVEDVSRRTGDANIWPVVQQYAQGEEPALVKPNGELLQPRWAASGGRLEGDSGASTTWRAPAEPGTYVLTLIVSDGVVRVGQELRIAVQAAGVVSP